MIHKYVSFTDTISGTEVSVYQDHFNRFWMTDKGPWSWFRVKSKAFGKDDGVFAAFDEALHVLDEDWAILGKAGVSVPKPHYAHLIMGGCAYTPPKRGHLRLVK